MHGIVAAMVTPFEEDGRPSIEETARLVDFLIDRGIHGLFVCGSTGEGVLLSTPERKLVAEATVRQARGRLPVIVHTGSLCVQDAVELTVHAREVGADGAALVPPFYYSLDELALLNYYRTAAHAVPDFPVYVYNIPHNS